MLDKRKVFICLVIASIPLFFNLPFWKANTIQAYHKQSEIFYFQGLADTLPGGYNSLFSGSGECKACHGYDTAGIASVDLLGNDINLVDDWRPTMMANSAKDPFWRAKVSHEILSNPLHQQDTETKCTSCHAPQGHFDAIHNGQAHYSMAEMLNDPLALDGVSCLACHRQSSQQLGALHSGNLIFEDSADVAYGPFESPLISPMVMETGYEPVYSPHISDAGICAGCHTLVTESFDLDGNATGVSFYEQTTYQEWVNSEYESMDISCQSCHMPKLDKGQFILIAGFETEPRDEFYLHDLVGGNTFMLQLMKENKEALGIAATDEQYDEVIAKTYNLLQNKTLEVNLDFVERTSDSAFFNLELINKSGHKFPSGYPARRAFVQFLVKTMEGDTLFISGELDNSFELVGIDANYEPHYNTINDENQVQIYEMIASNTEGDVTTVLEHMYQFEKDNRLPPAGFSSSHFSYDSTAIYGNALSDLDFNYEGGVEGSGSDKIQYRISLGGSSEPLEVSAKIYYQAIPPGWLEDMFSYNSSEINTFRDMYNAADQMPVLMKERSIMVPMYVGTQEIEAAKPFVRVVNNLVVYGFVNIESAEVHRVEVYDMQSRLIERHENKSGSYSLDLSSVKGSYLLYFEADSGKTYTKRILIF